MATRPELYRTPAPKTNIVEGVVILGHWLIESKHYFSLLIQITLRVAPISIHAP